MPNKTATKERAFAGLARLAVPQAGSNAPMNDIDQGVEEELELLREDEAEMAQDEMKELIKNAIREWIRTKLPKFMTTSPSPLNSAPKSGAGQAGV